MTTENAPVVPPVQPKKDRRLWYILGGVIAFICLLCTIVYAITPKTASPAPDANAIYTAAAQTALAGIPNNAQQPVAAPTDTPMPQATDTAVPTGGKTRNNPISGKAGIDLGGDMTLTVIALQRGADQIVASANMFNATPAAGIEYVLVQIQVDCRKSANDKCTFIPSDIKSVGSDGQVRDYEFTAGLPDTMSELTYEFFGGSRVGGVLVFQFPKSDVQVVLFHEPLIFGDPVYFTAE